jgi:FKBP-type peptidyl-prolyl cis-trans isomerase
LPRGRRLLGAAGASLLLSAGACGADEAPPECHRRPLTTESRLEITDIRCGRGEPARSGDVVEVHYVGRLAGGPVFDRSGSRPFTFPLGRGQVIRGWDEGLVGMRPGGSRRLVIPPELAYGAAGYLDAVPPGATVVYRVTLLEARGPD